MRKAIAIIFGTILVFICGIAIGNHHAIMCAEPWVDTESNTILISFDGDVHMYEYWCE